MDEEIKSLNQNREMDFKESIYLHSIIGHAPGAYYDIYPSEGGGPMDVEEFVPESPEGFADMIKVMRKAGLSV